MCISDLFKAISALLYYSLQFYLHSIKHYFTVLSSHLSSLKRNSIMCQNGVGTRRVVGGRAIRCSRVNYYTVVEMGHSCAAS